jgi:hypothetical protein
VHLHDDLLVGWKPEDRAEHLAPPIAEDRQSWRDGAEVLSNGPSRDEEREGVEIGDADERKIRAEPRKPLADPRENAGEAIARRGAPSTNPRPRPRPPPSVERRESLGNGTMSAKRASGMPSRGASTRTPRSPRPRERAPKRPFHGEASFPGFRATRLVHSRRLEKFSRRLEWNGERTSRRLFRTGPARDVEPFPPAARANRS